LWAYAALRTGIPASQLIRRLGHAPLGLPILRLSVFSLRSSEDALVGTHGSCVRPQGCDISTRIQSQPPISLDSYKEDFSQVGKIFLDNPPRWYAMSLRPGVRFTEVCRRIRLLSDQIPDIQLFYPCEEIARAIGRKIVVRRRPFIHSVVFFRARLTDIGTLFAKIGAIAWCYRRSSRPGSPYADISQRQFELFQQTLDRFTPDYEVAPAGELKLRKNDRVRIVGGLFSGIEAGFDSEVTSSPIHPVGTHGSCVRTQSAASSPRVNSEQDLHTIYRLNIIGDNGIEWRISVDPRLVETPKSSDKPHPSNR
ncbi:MAG: hypothetical protein K2O47_06995, partial [Muribaculaceae bacterium]|nr:hypothetical protein [Muribaculaceae bacterium]